LSCHYPFAAQKAIGTYFAAKGTVPTEAFLLQALSINV
jgi:hypothetical protein